jgi:predicted PurR-regulated permease PerM
MAVKPDGHPAVEKFSSLKILQITTLLCVLLYFGRAVLIPLSFSLLISFILYPVCKWLEKKGIHEKLAIFISISFLTILMGALVYLLFTMFMAFSHEWQALRIKLQETVSQLSIFLAEQTDFSNERQLTFFRNAIDNSGSQFVSFMQSIIYSFTETALFLFIVPVFAALILYERRMLVKVLYMLLPANKRETLHEILVETIHAYYNFVKGMMLVYIIVGMLNSIGLAILGIPHPFLFGFIASVLTFIPYFGIMIASLLPITIAWITYNSIWYPLGVVLVFGIVQMLEANVIFPFAVSSRLKINTLVVLIVIIAGGILWGGAGMILFIPFLGILKLVADRTASLKALSMLLGDGSLSKAKK